MKLVVFCMAALFILITSCNESSKTSKTRSSTSLIGSVEGSWSRSFELGRDSVAHVFYEIGEDEIVYDMQGPLSVKYTMIKDTFLMASNRWIGKLHDNYYVIFFKNVNEESISLLKKQVANRKEALDYPFPDADTRSHFTSWNIYTKTK